MKVKLLLIVMFLINFTLQAQDKIIKKDGTELQVKVEEIQENVVKYRRLNNLTGPMYNIKKVDIAKIIYEKGNVETFVEGNSVIEEKKHSESSPRSIEVPEPPKVEVKAAVQVIEGTKKVVEVKPGVKEKVMVAEPKKGVEIKPVIDAKVVIEEPKKVVDIKPVIEEKKVVPVVLEEPKKEPVIEEKKVVSIVVEEPKKVAEVKPQVVIIEEKKEISVVIEEPKNILNSNTEHRVESEIIPADVLEQKSATNAIAKVIGIVMADKDGNEPIEGAIVTLEDGQTTKTNKNGVFNLLVVIGTEIEISHKEFDSKKVKIENAVVSVVLNKALVTFDMSLLKDVRIPQNKAQPIQIAYYYFINNQYKESAKVFEKYSEALSADDVYTWGDCYWKMGKFKEAINDYWTKAAVRGNEDANYHLFL